MTQREAAPFKVKDWPDDWPTFVTALVAVNVRNRRKQLKLSAQQLSEKCEELGMPIARSVLANLESGRRANISLPEVLILARALKISPLNLCIPIGVADRYFPTPIEEIDPWDAAKWFSGEAPFPGEESGLLPDSSGPYAPSYNDLTGLFRQHDQHAEMVRRARRTLSQSKIVTAEVLEKNRGLISPDVKDWEAVKRRTIKNSEENLRASEERLLHYRRVMQERGLTYLPPLHDLAYLETEGPTEFDLEIPDGE